MHPLSRILVAVLTAVVPAMAVAPAAAQAPSHPMDHLSAAEHWTAYTVIRASGEISDDATFGVEVAEKYQIHPQTLYRWRKALEQGAQAFLSGKKARVDPRIKKLEKENQRLKEALALQTQELMLLKKEMNLL